MFVVFRQLLRALGERAPIVAFVDDLQWADADSLALLSEVLRPPDAPRLLLLGTLRTQATRRAGVSWRPTSPKRSCRSRTSGVTPPGCWPASCCSPAAPRDPRSGRRRAGARISRTPAVFLELARTAHLRRGNGAHLTLDSVLRAQIESFPESTVRVLRTLAISGAPTPVRMLRRLCDSTARRRCASSTSCGRLASSTR